MDRHSPKRPFAPEAMLEFAWRRKWHIVLPGILIAAAASWGIHRLPNRYRSQAVLVVVPQQVSETLVRSATPMRASDRIAQLTQQILSISELERVIDEFDLYADRRTTDSTQEVVEAMRTRDLDVRPIKGDAFRLSYAASDPQIAQRVVERLVSLFLARTSADRAIVADGTEQFLEARLEEARRKLVDNEAKLAQYRQQHNGELPTQTEANTRGLHNTELQLQVLAESLNRDRDRQLMLERSIKDGELAERIDAPTARVEPTGAGTPALSAAQQLERAEAVLEQMKTTLTERHPDVVSLRQTIADLRKRADAEGARQTPIGEGSAQDVLRRSRLEELRAELASITQQIAQKTADSERMRRALVGYQRRIEAAPAREAEIAALTRDYDTLQQTYRGLLAKKQESEIATNLERQQIGAHFKVIDPAKVPEHPFSPNRERLYPLAVLGGFFCGIVFAAILERFNRRLRTQDDVIAALGLPVLAVIPEVSAGRMGRSR